MKMRVRRCLFSILMLVSLSVTAEADLHLRVPQDTQPPVYTSAAGPAFQPDGSIFAVHNSEWAAIPFWRTPACVPPGFNLLDQVDAPGAFDCPLLVEGFVRLQRQTFNLMSWEARGVGDVPVWFVAWSELETAMADHVLTKSELLDMGSLKKGNARIYNEQNHTFFGHPVSHLSIRASGNLEDGSVFSLQATEVALGLKQVVIKFREGPDQP